MNADRLGLDRCGFPFSWISWQRIPGVFIHRDVGVVIGILYQLARFCISLCRGMPGTKLLKPLSSKGRNRAALYTTTILKGKGHGHVVDTSNVWSQLKGHLGATSRLRLGTVDEISLP